MKFTGLLGYFVLLTSFVFSQTFEGKIIYQNSYKSKVPNIPDEQFNSMMGNRQEYLIKGGNYKSSMDGSLMQWQLYRNADNKLYMKMSNSPVIFWNDGSVNPDEVLKVEINKRAITLLGHQCDELILTCKSGVQKYYFSPKLKVDPKIFEAHKFGNWSEFVSRSKSLPLKVVVETAQFILESTATEITAKKLDDTEFELPAGSKLQKSPF